LLKKFPETYNNKGGWLDLSRIGGLPRLKICDLFPLIDAAAPLGRVHIFGKTPRTQEILQVDGGGARIPSAPDIIGQTGEFLTYVFSPDDATVKFSLKDVPLDERARMAEDHAKAAQRPKWDERGKYAELKDLSSPKFLKRVYADEIAPDGTIRKDAVRKVDPKLMGIVEAYISDRERRGLNAGEAEGLRLVATARPARVRSRIRLRSNSAKALNI
jgi:hypothetical protein